MSGAAALGVSLHDIKWRGQITLCGCYGTQRVVMAADRGTSRSHVKIWHQETAYTRPVVVDRALTVAAAKRRIARFIEQGGHENCL